MADDVFTPIDMGFAEFVAKLISDVFDAVVSSKVDQQEKLLELEKIVSQPDDLFIDYLLNESSFVNQVDEVLKFHFPDESEKQPHLVYVGSSYSKGRNVKSESPSYYEKLGVELTDDDFLEKKLTEQGVLKIYKKAAEPLAILKRSVFLKILEDGLNKLVVDSGTISAKLNFSTTMNSVDTANEPQRSVEIEAELSASNHLPLANLTPTLTKKFITPIQPINHFVGLLKTDLSKQVRLTVKQADGKSSPDQASANIFSEVEIKFRSV